MNRQDKLQKMYDKRLKRARTKIKNSSKERYISKADRAKAESENSVVASDANKYEETNNLPQQKNYYSQQSLLVNHSGIYLGDGKFIHASSG